MGWIKFESFRLSCPDFADVFVGCEAAECLQATRKIVCGEKVAEMRAQLIMAVVVKPFDRGVFDSPIHSLDLPIRPGMAHLGQSVFDPVFCTAHSKHMG